MKHRRVQVLILAACLTLGLVIGFLVAFIVADAREEDRRDARIVRQNQEHLLELLADNARQDACLVALAQALVDPKRDRNAPVLIPAACRRE